MSWTIRRFQDAATFWGYRCFGYDKSRSLKLTAYRALEEMNELAQVAGITEEQAVALVRYTWGRPVGEARNEIGGVMVTLARTSNILGIQMSSVAPEILKLCEDNIDRIREKDLKKIQV